MTAVATPTRAHRAGGWSRTWNVVRLQLINAQSFVWVPLLILGGALVICLIIFAMIPTDEPKFTGAVQSPMWYFFALGLQAMTLTFPFSQAMSVTRREFYLGTLIVGVIGSAMVATLIIAVSAIEVLTDGWGMNGWFAYLDWVFDPGWPAAWLTYFTATMFLYTVGFWAATVWKRWGTLVITVVMIGIALLVVIAAFVITRIEAWPQVIAWFAQTGTLGLTLYALGLIALMAVGSYATLRKATV